MWLRPTGMAADWVAMVEAGVGSFIQSTKVLKQRGNLGRERREQGSGKKTT